jgi:hypothetical protein
MDEIAHHLLEIIDADYPSPLENFNKLSPSDILYGNVESVVFQVGTAADV